MTDQELYDYIDSAAPYIDLTRFGQPVVDREDIVNQAWLATRLAVESGRVREVRRYAATVTVKLSLDAIRARGRQRLAPVDWTKLRAETPSPEERAAAVERSERLRGLIATCRFTSREREIVTGHFLEGSDRQDVRQALGLSGRQYAQAMYAAKAKILAAAKEGICR